MLAKETIDWWARGIAAAGVVFAYANYRYTKKKDAKLDAKLEPVVKVDLSNVRPLELQHQDQRKWVHQAIDVEVSNTGGSPLDIAKFVIYHEPGVDSAAVLEWDYDDKRVRPLNQRKNRLDANGYFRLTLIVQFIHPTANFATIRVAAIEGSKVEHLSDPIQVPVNIRPGMPAPVAM